MVIVILQWLARFVVPAVEPAAMPFGVMAGIAVDYLGSAANEAINRDEFIAANNRALDATIETWKASLAGNLDAAVDKWFDDARSSVVLSSR